MSKKDLLLNAIEDMLNGNIDKTNAICENLDVKLGGSLLNGYDIVKILSPSWKHFSGEPSYPVSGETTWDTINFDNPELWWTGEQLELRMSLLEHIKSELLKLTDEEVEDIFQ